MTRLIASILACCAALTCGAENDTEAPPVAPPAPANASAPTHSPAPIRRLDPPDEGVSKPGVAAGNGEALFQTDAKWQIAGYNENEVVFTIFITSHDTRIIRCTTQIHGSYLENGQKISIDDRAESTAFPDQQVQVGNWMGMDQDSGATYSVKCRPV